MSALFKRSPTPSEHAAQRGSGSRAVQAVHILPGAFTPWLYRGFGKYVARLFRKKFHSVRIVKGGVDRLSALNTINTPTIVMLNHSSWWDPLVCVLLGSRLLPDRTGFGPMDIAMLRKFGIFKKLGLFGVDPDDPAALKPMLAYCLDRFKRDRKPTMWVTPQGRFSDVRDEIVLRPGTAAIAARACRASVNGNEAGTSASSGDSLRVIAIAVEYVFWIEQSPEVLLRIVEVKPPTSTTTAGWHRALTNAMRANAAELATCVRARDPDAFENLFATKASSTNPFYDLWLRVLGKQSNIEVVKRGS